MLDVIEITTGVLVQKQNPSTLFSFLACLQVATSDNEVVNVYAAFRFFSLTGLLNTVTPG